MSDQLKTGDVLAWINGLQPDRIERFDDDVTVVLAGAVQIVISPHDRGEGGGHDISAHTHATPEDAARCFERIVTESRVAEAEFRVSPQAATARAQARSMGMPQEMIDALMPLPAPVVPDTVPQAWSRLAIEPEDRSTPPEQYPGYYL